MLVLFGSDLEEFYFMMFGCFLKIFPGRHSHFLAEFSMFVSHVFEGEASSSLKYVFIDSMFQTAKLNVNIFHSCSLFDVFLFQFEEVC